MHAKYPICKNERTLRETFIMSVFNFLGTKNAKTHDYHSVWRNRATLPKMCILDVFTFFDTKTLKFMQIIFTVSEAPKRLKCMEITM